MIDGTEERGDHMAITKLLAFLMALITLVTGGVSSVVGSTDKTPITATKREYRFDRDRLLFGAYCLKVDEDFEQTREWFKEAKLQFPVAVSGRELTEEALDWFVENGMGLIAPRSDYYMNMKHDAIWGIDLYDEPSAAAFPALQERVQELYRQDPHRFPLVNLLPMYASPEQLGEETELPDFIGDSPLDPFSDRAAYYRMHVSDYIGTIDSDIISVDIYPFVVGADGTLGTYMHWMRNLDILAEACRRTGRDLWVITQASGMVEVDEGKEGYRFCDTVEDQRWQNYVSIAFGAKAIIYGCYYGGWWSADSHMLDNDGQRTDTYYAVKQVNEEMSVFAGEYGKYENHGAIMLNRVNPKASGVSLGTTKVDPRYRPAVLTADPVLCGCFSEKEGDGKAFVFTNMFDPNTGRTASLTASFPGAKRVTLYRKGEKTVLDGCTLCLTLENREGVFVTVE